MKKLDDIDRSIKKLNSSGTSPRGVEGQNDEAGLMSKLSILVDKIDYLMGGKFGQTIEDKISSMDRQLSNIFKMLRGGSEKAEEANVFQEDRKRLKERLKAAVESKDSTNVADRTTTWMEYFFGIRKADGRIGKERSRYSFSWMIEILHSGYRSLFEQFYIGSISSFV